MPGWIISKKYTVNEAIMAKKKKPDKDPDIHDDLEGFDININEFGEIIANFDVDKLNNFLDENVEDKKLRDRDDLKRSDEEE